MGLKAISGKNGKQARVFIGSWELCVESWTLREMVREEETTNSCSQGKEEYEYGTKHCEGTLSFTLDLSAHPLDNPPALITGSKISNVTFYEHSTGSGTADGSRWIFTEIAITELSVDAPAIGKLKYEINWKSTGLYSNPSENAGSSV